MELKNYLYIGAAIFALDQAIKLLMRNLLDNGRELQIIGDFFKLRLTHNTGAAFSILTGNNLLLIFVSFFVIGLIVYYMYKSEDERLPLSLVLGGAIGNLIDRIFLGSVVDFIDISIWPVFNVADMAITAGIALIILDLIKKKK